MTPVARPVLGEILISVSLVITPISSVTMSVSTVQLPARPVWTLLTSAPPVCSTSGTISVLRPVPMAGTPPWPITGWNV